MFAIKCDLSSTERTTVQWFVFNLSAAIFSFRKSNAYFPKKYCSTLKGRVANIKPYLGTFRRCLSHKKRKKLGIQIVFGTIFDFHFHQAAPTILFFFKLLARRNSPVENCNNFKNDIFPIFFFSLWDKQSSIMNFELQFDFYRQNNRAEPFETWSEQYSCLKIAFENE